MIGWTFRQVKRVVVFVVGSAVLGAGIAMIVLPGPAIIVIPMGLAILASEFQWARDALRHARQWLRQMKARRARPEKKKPRPSPSAEP